MAALTQQQKQTVTVALILGAVFLALTGWFWISLGKEMVKEKNAQIDSLKKKNAQLMDQIAEMRTLDNMRSQYDDIQKKLDSISRRLPPTPEAPGFLNALSESLRFTGIDTKKLAPEKVNDFSRFSEIPYGVDAVGRYHEIGSFLTLVEQNPDRFMRVKTLKITNDPKRPSLHAVGIGISTYMYKETAATEVASR